MKKLLLMGAVLAATLTASAAETLKWSTDYPAALVQAKEQNRQVFLFFTGSDWCIWCKRLTNEILSAPEFSRYAGEKLLLVEVDFPEHKAQSVALKEQNVNWRRRITSKVTRR